MDTPGLLPEGSEPRRSPLRWIWGLLAMGLLLVIALLAVQLVRLKRERDKDQARMDNLLGQLKRPSPAPVSPVEPPSLARRLEELESRLGQVEAARRAGPAAPAPAPGVREAAPMPARSVETEAMIYVHVSVGFAGRGLYPEAVRSLGEALRLDPSTFWKLRPRSLIASEADYEKLLADLERRVREDPLDAEAKTVLAYLYFHEKGPDQAKVLLLQVLAASPDHAVAKKLLEGLER